MHAGEMGWPHQLNSINVDYMTLHCDDVTMRLPGGAPAISSASTTGAVAKIAKPGARAAQC
jgi:hypothetical protein